MNRREFLRTAGLVPAILLAACAENQQPQELSYEFPERPGLKATVSFSSGYDHPENGSYHLTIPEGFLEQNPGIAIPLENTVSKNFRSIIEIERESPTEVGVIAQIGRADEKQYKSDWVTKTSTDFKKAHELILEWKNWRFSDKGFWDGEEVDTLVFNLK